MPLATVGLPFDLPGRLAAGAAAPVSVLVGLFVLFVGAKLGEELARRLGQPAVVGELAGGFLVGPHALGLVTPGESAAVFAELGVVILLFGVGLEVRLDDLLAVGRSAVATALVAMALPIAAGVGIGLAIGEGPGAATFLGLALAATSIGITSRVLRELGVLDRSFSRVILGAAVIDDVLALILVGIVSGAAAGDPSATALPVAVAAIGLVGIGFFAARRVRGLSRATITRPRFADSPLLPGFILMLGVALLSASVGLAAIVGAFVAGLVIAETEVREELEHETRPLAAVFTPFFFAVTGAQVDLGALADPALAFLAIGLAALGIGTKVLGGLVGARSLGRWGSLAVGIGMAPRGEVGIVVATLGLTTGLVSPALFGATLVAVVITTIVPPSLLAIVVPRAIAAERAGGAAAP